MHSAIKVSTTRLWRSICAVPGVKEVHDLHIWGMSTTEVALTAHVK